MAIETDQLWEACEKYLAAEDLELDDLDVGPDTGGKGPRMVRITVDGDGGVGVDRLARISRALSRMLDEEDRFADPYTLEVTSPGLERRLRRQRHYEKSLGSDIKVKSKIEIDGARNHRGVLESVDSEGFVMIVDALHRRIDFEHVQTARTVFEWKKAPKPGKKSG